MCAHAQAHKSRQQTRTSHLRSDLLRGVDGADGVVGNAAAADDDVGGTLSPPAASAAIAGGGGGTARDERSETMSV